MKRMMLLIMAAFVALVFSGCKKEGADRQVPVSATAAYEKYFGSPPTSNKGGCFAFVIYFPSALEKGKLVPFPFFTFDKPTMKKVSIERLLGGMDVPAYRGEILNPFPAGTHLLTLSARNGLETLELSNQGGSDPALRKAGRNAIVLTLKQFPGVKAVDTIKDGERTRLKLPPDSAVKEPGTPRLLGVAANKDKGAQGVEDVSILFDRPLDIRELSVTDRDGKGFPGDMYHSVFDMAAVLKPRQPGRFEKGMPIRVKWKVVDRKGRAGAGEAMVPLQVHEH